MDYDFASYLAKVDPNEIYKYQRLTGGLVNITVRATKQNVNPEVLDTGRFPGRSSIILKYAPPYVAAVGESAPFSQERQAMEARALAKFTAPDGHLQNLGHDMNLKVPDLLHYDKTVHVLILEDLGEVISLATWLSNLDSISPLSQLAHLNSETALASLASDLGRRIGLFFGRLHAPSTLCQASLKGDGENGDSRDNLENNFGYEVVLDCAIAPIESKLAKYIRELSKSREISRTADQLWSIVIENYTRKVTPQEQSFVLGDFYPGSLLLPKDTQLGSTIGVIDWEFSGLGRGPHGDMAQCLAHLHLAALRCENINSARYIAVENLVREMLSAYVDECRKNGGLLDMRSKSKEDGKWRLISLFRSAVILYAGEMLNMEYPSNEDKDSTDSKIRAQNLKIANSAIWCLEKVSISAEHTADKSIHQSIVEELKEDAELNHLWGMYRIIILGS